MAFEDGWKASGEVLVSGPATMDKAELVGDIFWKRLKHEYESTRTEVVGTGSIWPDHLTSCESNEVLVRFGVRDHDWKKVNDFGKKLSTLILSGPAGMAVTGQGRPKPKQVIAYWPALIHRTRVKARVLTITTKRREEFYEITFPVRAHAIADKPDIKSPARKKVKMPGGRKKSVRLEEICYARSGDKGDTCNIGVLARSPQVYEWMLENLTTQKVKQFFKGITKGKVIRYELDNLHGLNFLLEETLGGGGTRSLMIDPQGKTLAQALLQMKVDVPGGLLRTVKGK